MRWDAGPEDTRTNLVLAVGLRDFLQEHRTKVIYSTAALVVCAFLWVIFVDSRPHY